MNAPLSSPPSARSVRHALGVLERLPPVALAELAERIIDWLDADGGDPDLEPDQDDACQAEDVPVRRNLGIGDEDDGEPEADDEPDDEDHDLGSEDEPTFDIPRCRACPPGRCGDARAGALAVGR